MSKFPETAPHEWGLEDWEKTLNINVGVAFACRACGNLAMAVRGGVGVLEMNCCGKPMERVNSGFTGLNKEG